MSERYNHKKTEAHWQKIWAEKEVFQTSKDNKKEKYYVLEMFPYPSGKIHMGHVRNYTLGDVVARYKKMSGFNVLHPMGWDAFGLPAENAAIVEKKPPKDWTYQNINVMRSQLKSMGLSIDWKREIATCHPKYYKHEQLFFLELYKKGLAYKKESMVNWDPVDLTVLANEQVIDGRGWRSGAVVEQKNLSQWFLKTSLYSEELLQHLEKLNNWPEKVKIMQSNWIGKSSGAEINFEIANPENLSSKTISVFTTRPDTIFGATFCAISIEHPIALEIITNDSNAKNFENKCKQLNPDKEKIGFKTSLLINHPFENKTIPVFIANFILMDYGSGAIFGCPGHDQRDLDFANKYNLPVLPVILPTGQKVENFKITNEAYIGEGSLINSSFLNGKNIEEAKKTIIKKLLERGLGKEKINYRLRDWGLSRQRYWGCPIPVMYREDGEIIAVKKEDLPVELPNIKDFSGTGNILEKIDDWKNTKCPFTGMRAVRETDTFDTFFESSWYYLRYCNPRSEDPFIKEDIKYWLPVDQYIGGIEHAILHLLYSRFFVKALRDLDFIDLDEPFEGLFTQGMVTHKTFRNSQNQWLSPDEIKYDKNMIVDEFNNEVKIGKIEKMSKSKKNTVDPSFIIKNYGADTARWFMLSDSPPDRDLEWTDNGVASSYKFINKIWDLVEKSKSYQQNEKNNNEDLELKESLNLAIENITKNIELFHFNKAVANIYELLNAVQKNLFDKSVSRDLLIEVLKTMSLLMHPFVPHLSEEVWRSLGSKELVICQKWPESGELKKKKSFKIAVQINGKTKQVLDIKNENNTENSIKKIVMDDKKIKKFIQNKQIKRTIYVPKKILNIVL